MRIMGLDYGTKTVGVALSDPLGLRLRDWKRLNAKKRTS